VLLADDELQGATIFVLMFFAVFGAGEVFCDCRCIRNICSFSRRPQEREQEKCRQHLEPRFLETRYEVASFHSTVVATRVIGIGSGELWFTSIEAHAK
jgi:hypothetical protein